MSVLTFCDDPRLRGSHEDLGDCIQQEQKEGVEGCEGVAEVDESRDEDEDVEDERSDVDQSH